MQAAVFLDRDNTVIRNDGDLGDPEKVVLIQGAASAIASLKGLGYRIVVVTNQGGVARGLYTVEDVEKVHQKINDLIHANSAVKVDRFYFCPYHPQGTVEAYRQEHPWRKPQPGMLLQAAKDMELDLSQSWMIGDQLRDIEAGAAAGVRTILLVPDAPVLPPLMVDQPRQVMVEGHAPMVQPGYTAKNLIEATRVIAQQRRPERISDEEWEKLTTPGSGGSKPQVTVAAKATSPIRPGVRPVTVAPAPASAETAPRPPRPFRPWDAPPDEDEPSRRPQRVKPQDAAAETEPQTLFHAPAPAPEPAPALEPTPTPAPAPMLHAAATPRVPEPEPEPEPAPAPTPAPAPAPVLQAAPTPRIPAPTPIAPPAAPAPAPEETPSDVEPDAETTTASPTRPAMTGQERLLRQILHELRTQRTEGDGFSYLRMFATVLQMLTVVCLLAALLLGSGDLAMFIRWMAVGMLVQAATIAMLLFDR
ncbi:MAG: HAD family hydrolase [Phycisphaeraceae bacterium]|nr:HAD family hydrolase [Phycisphaeraceae bacterium]